MKKALAILVLVALLAALAVAAAPTSADNEQATQSARTITVTDDKYTSGGLKIKNGAVTVPSGSTVSFVWSGTSNRHNVKSTSGDIFKSKTTSKSGYRYSHKFRSSSSMKCTIHPSSMKLKVFTK